MVTYFSIQYLRAFAALLVVVFHTEVQLRRLNYAGEWPHWLASGVDIFFVISGLIMWLTTSGGGITPLQFYWRRIVRIVPLYWLLTSVMVIALMVAPRVVQSGAFVPYHILASYLFVPAIHPLLGTMEPVLIPGWTLNYEMFFYAIFGLALLLTGAARLWVMLLALLVVAVLGVGVTDSRTALGFYTSSIILEFGFGIAIAYGLQNGWRLPVAWAVIAVIGGLAALAFLYTATTNLPHGIGIGLPAACIVAGAVSLELRGHVAGVPILKLLGDASYSIYLSHGPVLSALGQAWREAGIGDSDSSSLVLFGLLAPVLATIAGVLVYWFVEKPLIGLFRSRARRAPLPAPRHV